MITALLDDEFKDMCNDKTTLGAVAIFSKQTTDVLRECFYSQIKLSTDYETNIKALKSEAY
jgi:hypothetical protein